MFLLQMRNHHHISEESVQSQLRKLAVVFSRKREMRKWKCRQYQLKNKTCRREFTSHAFEAEINVKRVRVKIVQIERNILLFNIMLLMCSWIINSSTRAQTNELINKDMNKTNKCMLPIEPHCVMQKLLMHCIFVSFWKTSLPLPPQALFSLFPHA